jgi:hypothetical protein
MQGSKIKFKREVAELPLVDFIADDTAVRGLKQTLQIAIFIIHT